MHRLYSSAPWQRLCSTSIRSTTSRASSLGQAVRTAQTIESLDLQESSDLLCVNLMCEKVGEPCICRLSGVLERLPQLKHLNLSQNQLTSIPESIGKLGQLRSLDLSNNKLTDLPSTLRQLSKLQVLCSKQLEELNFAKVYCSGPQNFKSLSCAETGPQGQSKCQDFITRQWRRFSA